MLRLVFALPCLVYANLADAQASDAATNAPQAAEAPPVRPRSVLTLTPPRTEPSTQRWYGWQTAISNGLSLVLALGSTRYSSRGVIEYGWVIAAVVPYLLGAPIIHLAHRNVLRAGLYSFVLQRLALPLVSLLIGAGAELSLPSRRGYPVTGAVVGLALSAVVSSVLDSVFAYSDEGGDDLISQRRRAPMWALSPMLGGSLAAPSSLVVGLSVSGQL